MTQWCKHSIPNHEACKTTSSKDSSKDRPFIQPFATKDIEQMRKGESTRHDSVPFEKFSSTDFLRNRETRTITADRMSEIMLGRTRLYTLVDITRLTACTHAHLLQSSSHANLCVFLSFFLSSLLFWSNHYSVGGRYSCMAGRNKKRVGSSLPWDVKQCFDIFSPKAFHTV